MSSAIESPSGVAGYQRQPPSPWIAVVGDSAALDELADLGTARRLVVPPGTGARGLGVVTVDGGPSPVCAARGAAGVLFEGVLHNRRALMRQLGFDSGAEPSSAKIVIAAYERWGEEFPERLLGPHALVLWDGREQRLVASRDRLGVYPLAYAEVGRLLVLSTSADLVRRHPGVPADLHRAKLTELLCLQIFDLRETGFLAIRKVAPAHRLVHERGAARERCNWRPETIGTLPGTLGEHLERFEALLDGATERAIAPGRLAILLSGGLDSVSVAATAADRCRALGIPAPHALSLVFPNPEDNEEAVQRRVAAQLGLPITVREYFEASGGRGRSFLASVRASARFAAPALTVWRPSYLRLLADGHDAGARTVLTGHGGDEWLGVSIYLAADHVRRLELGKLWRQYRMHRRSFRTHFLRSAQFVFWKYGARPVLAAAAARALGPLGQREILRRKRRKFRHDLPDWVAPDPALRRELAERAERYLPDPIPGDFYAHSIQSSLDHPAGDYEYGEIFEVGRQVGVCFSSPYLDEELVDYLIGVPPEILFAGGRNKGLVRSSLARRFPELGFERQKKVGTTSFFRQLIHEEGPAALAGLGSVRTLAELGVVDVPRWDAYTVGSLSRGPAPDIARLWFALSTESWVRQRC